MAAYKISNIEVYMRRYWDRYVKAMKDYGNNSLPSFDNLHQNERDALETALMETLNVHAEEVMNYTKNMMERRNTP